MSIQPLTFPTKVLAGALAAAGTRLILPDIKHWDTNNLTSAEVGTVIYATLQDFARTKMEIVELDPTTLTVATSTGVLINKRALGFMGGTTAAAETAYDWTPNETYVQLGSNPPQILTDLVDLNEAQTISGKKTFSTVPDSTADAVAANDLVRKSQLTAAGLGTLTVTPVVTPGNGGETLTIDTPVYLDPADNEWKKLDASTGATCENLKIGITRGAGTDGAAITNGVTIFGEHVAATAIFTADTKYYASDTAGSFSTSAGTVEVTLGISRSTTAFLLIRGYDQLITEDQLDALAGTSGTPSASNLLITEADAIRAPIYAATATGNDTYVITPDPAIADYAAGQEFKILADVDNTGACTLNVNAKGAKNIKTQDGSDPSDGYIDANSLLVVIYDGTNMVLQTPDAAGGKVAAGVTAAFSGTAAGNNDVSIDEGIVPKLIKVHYWIQGHTVATGTNVYTAQQGLAVYNGSGTLIFNNVLAELAQGGDNTAIPTQTASPLSIDPASTSAPTAGTATGVSSVKMTLSIPTISGTAITLRRKTEADNPASTARAKVAYEIYG